MNTSRTLFLALLAALTFAACDSTGSSSSVNADAGDDQTVDVGALVTLSGASSTDADGGTLTYAWAFATQPGGSTATLASSSASATFTPDIAGTYVARLTVSNGTDSDTDEVTITAEQALVTSLDADVTADRTLAAGIYEVPAGRTVRIAGGALTLSPGVQIRFGSGAGLQVNSDGALVSAGTAAQPVVLRGEQDQRGWWRGLAIYSSDVRNRLAHTTVANGGGARFSGMFAAANVALDDGARLTIEDATIRDSDNIGLAADPGAAYPSFARNTFTGNATYGVYGNPLAAGAFDAASTYAGNGDDFVLLYDRNVTDDLTLVALDVPYLIDGSPDVAGAQLTLAAGVEMAFRADAGLQVNSDGAVRSEGTESAPNVLRGEQATPGYWRGLAIYSRDARNRLAHTTVAHGGGARFSGMFAAATVALDDGARIEIEDATIRDSGTLGLSADPGVEFGAFGRNTFTDNETSPIQLAPQTAEAFDTASSFAGNEDDFVELYDRNVTDDMTLAALDVPYRVSGVPDVAGALLTVAAGTNLVFASDAGLQINSNAALDIQGTASQRVTARGEQATPGYWRGIVLYSNDTRNAIANATIEHGGGARYSGLGTPANVALDDNVRLTITNSTIRDSAGWGIQVDANAILTATGVTYTDNASGDVNGG